MTCELSSCLGADINLCGQSACWFATWTPEQQQMHRDIKAARTLPVGPTITIPLEPGYYVYRHFDIDGNVLYVGYTKNPTNRVANHVAQRNRVSHWWPLVHSIEWTRYELEAVAVQREVALIAQLLPPFNKHGRPRNQRYTKRDRGLAEATLERRHAPFPYPTGNAAFLLRSYGHHFLDVLDALDGSESLIGREWVNARDLERAS